MNMRKARKEARKIAAVLIFDATHSEVISGDDRFAEADKKRIAKALRELIYKIDPQCSYVDK